MAQMFFSTSSRSALPNHASAKAASTNLAQALRDGAKYREVRGRKAMTQQGWKPSEVPRPTKLDCHYQKEFIPRPLDNAPLDRAAARLQMESDRSGGQFATGQSLSSETTSKAMFPAYPFASPPPPAKPPSPSLQRGGSGLLERESAARRQFQAYDQGLMRSFRAEAAKPVVNQAPLPRPCEAGKAFSKYKEDFSSSSCIFRPNLIPGASKPRALDHDVLSSASTPFSQSVRRVQAETSRGPWH